LAAPGFVDCGRAPILSGMNPRPLTAVEDPPDFPTQGRTNRYTVIDTARNRVVGRIRGEQVGLPLEHWVWAISVPPAVGVGSLNPAGKVGSRDQALAAFKAAWLVYHDEPNWPPRLSAAWLDPGSKEGQGAWLPGTEPRGWVAK
jgi:hypothetical protein